MPISLKKNIIYYASIALVVFFIGFVLSSGLAFNASKKLSNKVVEDAKKQLYHHILTLGIVDARHYFLLPEGGYSKELFTQPWPFTIMLYILVNSIFNVLFQPVFFCPFIPQVILNIVLFPFFLYGAIRYFRKAWFILILFIILSFKIGIYDSGVEALIRHGMICELLYLLIGLAGFTGWITRNS